MLLFHCGLALHVAAGAVALLAGPVPMAARKGGRLHRRAGNIFACAMVVTAASALLLAAISGKVLLLALAVFTFFLVFSGVRAIGFLRARRPSRADDAMVILTIAFGVWLFGRGAWDVDVTSLIFGVLTTLLALRHWRLLRDPQADWLVAHLTSMGAAYTATATAFSVVNLTFLPQAFDFILPTLVGIPLITWARARYGRETDRRRVA